MNKLKETMKKELTQKQKIILSITVAIWGVILIGSGLILNAQDRTITKTIYSLDVSQKRVVQQRTNEIKLKDFELEINSPLSVDVKDYLEDIDKLDDSVFDYLKLDTSTVKITEAGTYTYTVTYKKKKYNGTIKIKEKELPNVQLQLKNVEIEVGSPVPTDLTNYISTPLTDEMKANITLDISQVKNTEPNDYQFVVTYNKATYFGIIKVYTPKPSTSGVITQGSNSGGTTQSTNQQ